MSFPLFRSKGSKDKKLEKEVEVERFPNISSIPKPIDETVLKKTEEIYRILTQPEMRRAKPNHPDKVKTVIYNAIKNQEQICLTGLWGGSKITGEGTDSADYVALNRLSILKKQILGVYPTAKFHGNETKGASVAIIFCNLHHWKLNDADVVKSSRYWMRINMAADDAGIYSTQLSPFFYCWDRSKEENTAVWIYQKSPELFVNKFLGDQIVIQAYLKELFKDEKFASAAIEAAVKHSKLTERGYKPEDIAKMYVALEMYFIKGIAKEWRDENIIFFSYSNPIVQKPLFMNHPALFFYAMKRGFGDCPWYTAGIESLEKKIIKENKKSESEGKKDETPPLSTQRCAYASFNTP